MSTDFDSFDASAFGDFVESAAHDRGSEDLADFITLFNNGSSSALRTRRWTANETPDKGTGLLSIFSSFFGTSQNVAVGVTDGWCVGGLTYHPTINWPPAFQFINSDHTKNGSVIYPCTGMYGPYLTSWYRQYDMTRMADNNCAVIWANYSAPNFVLYGQVFNVSGTVGARATIKSAPVPGLAFVPFIYPSVLGLPNGNIAVSYFNDLLTTPVVGIRMYDSSLNPVTAEQTFQIGGGRSSGYQYAKLFLLDDETFMFVCTEPINSGSIPSSVDAMKFIFDDTSLTADGASFNIYSSPVSTLTCDGFPWIAPISATEFMAYYRRKSGANNRTEFSRWDFSDAGAPTIVGAPTMIDDSDFDRPGCLLVLPDGSFLITGAAKMQHYTAAGVLLGDEVAVHVTEQSTYGILLALPA